MNIIIFDSQTNKFGILIRCIDQFYCYIKPFRGNINDWSYIMDSRFLADIFIWEN